VERLHRRSRSQHRCQVVDPQRGQGYVAHGITRFLLTYVGRQTKEVQDLTTSNGRRDGDEACQIAKQFGFGAGTPICFDVVGNTFDASPRGSLDYACGWCEGVRASRLRPGVYSNPRALIPLADRPNGPDWVWVAAFITTKLDPTVDRTTIRAAGPFVPESRPAGLAVCRQDPREAGLGRRRGGRHQYRPPTATASPAPSTPDSL
jgi:hypothetical protein